MNYSKRREFVPYFKCYIAMCYLIFVADFSFSLPQTHMHTHTHTHTHTYAHCNNVAQSVETEFDNW